jgi:phosphomannomutase
LVVNAGNGGAGQVVDLLGKQLPFSFIKIQYEPDGTFPNGVSMSLKASHQDRLVAIPFYM